MITGIHNVLADNWWEQCKAVTRVYAKKNGKSLRYITEHLDELKAWSFGAVEVFAPYRGGNEYFAVQLK